MKASSIQFMQPILKPKIQHRIVMYGFALLLVGGMLGGAKAHRLFATITAKNYCPPTILDRARSTPVSIHPRQVVVKPWKGRHHVYAVFVVPGGYRSDQRVTIALDQNETYCGYVVPADAQELGLQVAPGEYAMLGLFRTRTTIGLLAQGKKAQLEQPTNWTLATQKNE
jgi:hypothetical protein